MRDALQLCLRLPSLQVRYASSQDAAAAIAEGRTGRQPALLAGKAAVRGGNVDAALQRKTSAAAAAAGAPAAGTSAAGPSAAAGTGARQAASADPTGRGLPAALQQRLGSGFQKAVAAAAADAPPKAAPAAGQRPPPTRVPQPPAEEAMDLDQLFKFTKVRGGH